MITDVVADALVIFVFDGGMFGIGLATAVSYYVALIPLVCYFFRSNSILRLSFSFLSVAEWKEICKEGLIKASKRVCNTVKPVLLNSLSLLLGTSLALSAYGVTNQVRDFLISFSAGSAGAVILIGSLLHSQRDRDGLSCLSGFALKTIGIISVPGILCVAFSKSIAGFFIQDSAEVLEMASLSVRCVGIMIPFATFNGVFIAFMQITKRYRMSSVMSFLNRLIPIVTVSAVLGTLLGVNGLWWALPISEMLNAAIVLIVIRHTNGRFPRNAAEFLCLPPDFGYRPEDYIELFARIGTHPVGLFINRKRHEKIVFNRVEAAASEQVS